jgi:hypothetical protein
MCGGVATTTRRAVYLTDCYKNKEREGRCARAQRESVVESAHGHARIVLRNRCDDAVALQLQGPCKYVTDLLCAAKQLELLKRVEVSHYISLQHTR